MGRDTVLRAIDILRNEGLVFTVPRCGTYVSPNSKWRAAESTSELWQPTTQVDRLREPQPSARATPTGQDTPVPWSGQYPCGFLLSDRYCWW